MFFWTTIIIAAIILAALLVWRAGTAIRLDSEADVLAKWRAICPEHLPTSAVLEPSGAAALINLENGETGLLWARGRKAEGRVLKAGRFQEIEARLGIDLPDVNGYITVEITQPLVRRIWVETLKTVLQEIPYVPAA